MRIILTISLLFLFATVSSLENWEEPFAAKCELPSLGLTESCLIAQFSAGQNLSLALTLSTEALKLCGKFCDAEQHLSSKALKSSVAIAHRGTCPFEKKRDVATLLGYRALIIINNEDNFVVLGGELAEGIPVFLVHKSTLSRVTDAVAETTEEHFPIKISYGAKPLPQVLTSSDFM